MLDSPDGVCAGQGRFEYPAASVPSNTRRAASRPTTPPSPSGPAVHGAGLTHARHLRDLRPCAALRRWSPRLPEQHWPPAATARTDRGQPRIPGHRGAHQRSQLRLAQVGRLEASPRRSPGLPQQERVCGCCGCRRGKRERSPQLLSVQYRVGRCGTPPGSLFATLKEQGLTPARTLRQSRGADGPGGLASPGRACRREHQAV